MTIKALLREEIRDELEHLNKMEVGSEEYKVTVDGITKLVDRVNEIEKMENEHLDRVESREMEHELKLQQMKDENKDRFIKTGTTVFCFVGGVAITIWGTCTSMRFEKEDSFTSLLGREWVKKTTSFLKKW